MHVLCVFSFHYEKTKHISDKVLFFGHKSLIRIYCFIRCRSANSVALSLRSASPSSDQKNQPNLVSSGKTSYLTVPTVGNDGIGSNNTGDFDTKPTKRKSSSDVVISDGNLTHSSINPDLRQVYNETLLKQRFK